MWFRTKPTAAQREEFINTLCGLSAQITELIRLDICGKPLPKGETRVNTVFGLHIEMENMVEMYRSKHGPREQRSASIEAQNRLSEETV